MTGFGAIQLAIYLAVVLVAARLLGAYMARVYDGNVPVVGRAFSACERLICQACRIDPAQEMGWKTYASSVLAFGLVAFLATYAPQRWQGQLPLNPAELPAVPPDLAFNTAASFSTNTNWQAYGGETTMSHFTQTAALAVQNFVSAATGMAVLVALARGLGRRQGTLGNYWVDLVRGTLFILLPGAPAARPHKRRCPQAGGSPAERNDRRGGHRSCALATWFWWKPQNRSPRMAKLSRAWPWSTKAPSRERARRWFETAPATAVR